MVNGPVRGPHPIRVSGKSVKDDSSPVRGPHDTHPIRAKGQEKGNKGRDGEKKRSDGAEVLVAGVMRTSDPLVGVGPASGVRLY